MIDKAPPLHIVHPRVLDAIEPAQEESVKDVLFDEE